MNAIHRKLGLMLSGALVAVSVWACAVTRGADGMLTFTFAPDMTITARGLENALKGLTNLLDKCITGNFTRPCTPDEMAAINKAMDGVLARKGPKHGGSLKPASLL